MAAIPGWKASVNLTSYPSVALPANYVLTDSGDHKTFTNPTALQRYWDPLTVMTIQTSPDGSTWTTQTSGFTIQYVGGKVLFANAVTGATPGCRITAGNYYPYAFLGDSKSLDITNNSTILDVTTWQNPASPWKLTLPAINAVDVKLAKFWVTGTLAASMFNYLNTGQLCVVSLMSGNTATQRLEAYAYFKGDLIKVVPNAAITEDLDFSVNGQFYYVA